MTRRDRDDERAALAASAETGVRYAGLITGVRFLIVDTESTPSATGNHLVSFGAIHHDGRTAFTGGTYFLVQPGVAIENSWFHGVDDDQVATEYPFAARIATVTALLTAPPGSDLVVVCHNAVSDIGLLLREYLRVGAVMPTVTVLDTLRLARHLGVSGAGYALETLAEMYGHPMVRWDATAPAAGALVVHNALDDAKATGIVLTELLRAAAAAGYSDLTRLRADAQSERLSSDDYEPAGTTRTSHARSSALLPRTEPDPAHVAGHVPLPATPTGSEVSEWVAQTRACVALRCSLLPERADTVTGSHARLLRPLLADLDAAVTARETVTAATVLGVVLRLLPHVKTPVTITRFHDDWAARLRAIPRCLRASTTRLDACPDCYAGRTCPADDWPAVLAGIALGARDGWLVTPRRRTAWYAADGTGALADHTAAGRYELAAAAAWLLVDGWAQDGQPDTALAIADMVVADGLVEPRLLGYLAAVYADIDLDLAIATLDAYLPFPSSDRGWRNLAAYRAKLRAQAAAATRLHTAFGHRDGHTRPSGRHRTRRFTA